jgi:hypothetical protein
MASRRLSVASTSASDVATITVPPELGSARGLDAVAVAAVLCVDVERMCVARRRNVDVGGERRRRGRGLAERLSLPAADNGAVGRADLGVITGLDAGRRPVAGAAASAPVLEHGMLDSMARVGERRVGAVEEERAERRVGRDVRDREPDRAQHDHAQHEARAERQPVEHQRSPASSM